MRTDQTVWTCDRCRSRQSVELGRSPDGYWWELNIVRLSRHTAEHREPIVKELCSDCVTEVDRWLRDASLWSVQSVAQDEDPEERA